MDSFSRKSLFEQVRDAVAAQILDGSWKAGSSIPNEVDLARTYGISVGTMRRALSMLEDEGLLHRRQGRGTFVSDPSWSDLRDRFEHLASDSGDQLEPDIRNLSCSLGPATPEECERLTVSPTEDVIVFCQLVKLRGSSAIYREAHVPRNIFADINKAATWDIFSAAREHGLRLGGGAEKLKLKRPPQQVATALSIDPGATLLELDRVVLSLDGRPVEWLMSWSELSGMHYSVSLA